MDQLRFTIPEIIALVGTAQCLYVIVYMMFRSGRISRGGLALLYFLALGLGFFFDFAEGFIGDITEYYFYLQWFSWFWGPPLSVLLIIQIARISQVPALKHYWIIFLVPLSFAAAQFVVPEEPGCQAYRPCTEIREWLTVLGILSGGLSLLAIWANRGLFSSLTAEKTGKERYWLILALIFTNIFFLGAMFVSLSATISYHDAVLVRNILGLAFVYLVSTSLFRIYPQAVQISERKTGPEHFSNDENRIAEKVKNLLILDKVYHESAYSRADMARECETSEAIISKIINAHFKKSFPQLLNEYRVEDAKRLLAETDAPVRTVAEEVGFNSLPSFNRVFKDLTGQAPTQYRKSSK